MLRVEIAAALLLIVALASAGGIWYAHHRGYEQGRAAQLAADRDARQKDQAGQAQLVAQLHHLQQTSAARLATAHAALQRARGPCLDRPMPGDVVGILRRAGLSRSPPEKGADKAGSLSAVGR